MTRRNTNFRVRLVFDGVEHEIQTIQADMLRYELTALRQKWPTLASDAPAMVVMTSFLAWAAGKRLGLLPADLTWEAFSERVEDVDVLDVEPVDPTQTTPGTASSPG